MPPAIENFIPFKKQFLSGFKALTGTSSDQAAKASYQEIMTKIIRLRRHINNPKIEVMHSRLGIRRVRRHK